MSLNPLQWIRWLSAEWAPASVLRERLGLALDRIAELERKHQEATLVLKRKHSQEMASLEQSHHQEVRRLNDLYASGRLILPPPKSTHKEHGNEENP
jgi:hypothetical protein